MRPGLLQALLLEARVRQLIRERKWKSAFQAVMALEAVLEAL